jgi:hypothetical protein
MKRESPSRRGHFVWWRGSLPAVAVVVVGLAVGCTSAGDSAPDELADPGDGSLVGELATYIATNFDGTSETRYALRLPSGKERWLSFDSEPELRSGARV